MAPPPAPRRNTPLILGVAIAVGLLVLIAVLAVVGVAAWRSLHAPPPPAATTVTKEVPEAPETRATDDEGGGKGAPGETPPEKPSVAPEPATDPVAEATVVLERYLAADLGHDGQTMSECLGGQARARFNPAVVGQEDITVHSKKISGHNVRDDNTIEFSVAVESSPADSQDVKTDSQPYVLKRTDQGWLVTSTPEYPE